jgi:NAD(P)-dependent dehydrogenase (short-subunit alcohol dehydrogenase family)
MRGLIGSDPVAPTPGEPGHSVAEAPPAALFDRVKQIYGRIDLLFNNAGTSTRGIPFEDLTLRAMVGRCRDQSDRLVSLRPACVSHDEEPRAAGRAHHQQRSVSAHVPRRNSAPYASTKHALTGLTRSLSLDRRQYNIACGQIDIGNAATTRNEDTARGRLQATGRVEAEPRMDMSMPSPKGSSIWPRCRSRRTSSS